MKKRVIIILLVTVEICFLFLLTKSFSNREILKEKIVENKIDKKQFSMFIETDNGYVEYIESNKFPEGYTVNLEESKCLDTKGNVIEGILSGSGTNVTVTSMITSYCYLYFDLPPITAETLPSIAGNDIWDSTLEDDGYRYIGTNPDNYICFGTTDQDECTKDTDKYMYRIIGIFEASEGTSHIKLIKKEALNTTYAWNANYKTDVDWKDSDLYKGLNGSYFLTNADYEYMKDTNWNDKLAEWNYTATNTKTHENSGPSYYSSLSMQNIYLHELNRSTKTIDIGEWKEVNAKIGLMYASDYLLSLGSVVLNYYNVSSSESSLKTGWMHISNNDSSTLSTSKIEPPSAYEWTMTRLGNYYGNYYDAFSVYPSGAVDGYFGVDSVVSIRPVFYLTENIKIISGKGSLTDPFIIE